MASGLEKAGIDRHDRSPGIDSGAGFQLGGDMGASARRLLPHAVVATMPARAEAPAMNWRRPMGRILISAADASARIVGKEIAQSSLATRAAMFFMRHSPESSLRYICPYLWQSSGPKSTGRSARRMRRIVVG
jgi:hypothetical protein